MYRHKNLVYIPITKHASSTYTDLFQNKLGWEKTQSNFIDWDKDHVFSHIIHPYERHLKGTVEAIIKYGIRELVDHPKFSKLLTTAVFDLHSYPLTCTFGIERMFKIDWLLLDHPKYSGNAITAKFLQSNGIDISESDIPNIHESDGYKKKLTERIRQIREESDVTGTLTYFYENDVVIYSKIDQHTKLMNMEKKDWSEISWLTHNKNESRS
jgi:hypothetical protein